HFWWLIPTTTSCPRAARSGLILRASHGCSCAAPLVLAACCTPARVYTSLSLVLAVPSCAPVSATAPPQRLQRCKSFCISFLRSLLKVLIAFDSAPLGHCPSLGPRPPCRDDRQRQAAAVPRPAGGVQRWPAAGALARLGSGLPVAWGGRWRAACWEAPMGGLA